MRDMKSACSSHPTPKPHSNATHAPLPASLMRWVVIVGDFAVVLLGGGVGGVDGGCCWVVVVVLVVVLPLWVASSLHGF